MLLTCRKLPPRGDQHPSADTHARRLASWGPAAAAALAACHTRRPHQAGCSAGSSRPCTMRSVCHRASAPQHAPEHCCHAGPGPGRRPRGGSPSTPETVARSVKPPLACPAGPALRRGLFLARAASELATLATLDSAPGPALSSPGACPACTSPFLGEGPGSRVSSAVCCAPALTSGKLWGGQHPHAMPSSRQQHQGTLYVLPPQHDPPGVMLWVADQRGTAARAGQPCSAAVGLEGPGDSGLLALCVCS